MLITVRDDFCGYQNQPDQQHDENFAWNSKSQTQIYR